MEKQKARILIVDDEQPIRDFLATCLALDYNCITADSAERALQLLADRPYNLVLTDISMPGMSGIELCELIHQRHSDVVVVAMSGSHDTRFRVEVMKKGALYFMDKPISPTRVIKMVEAALSSQAAAISRLESERPAGDTLSVVSPPRPC